MVSGPKVKPQQKRFVTEMQQRKIDYKKDGINTVEYEIVEVIDHSKKCKIFNVKLQNN